MRVIVDAGRCDSTGLCAEAAPAVFELDATDVLRVRIERPAPEEWPAVEHAARTCPKLAITTRDD